jgi:hypothetical protein
VNNFGLKWGAYRGLYTLAQGDIRRFDEISRLKLHACLMYLAFETDKAIDLNKKMNKK